MKKYSLLIISILLFSRFSWATNSLDSIIQVIQKNNPSLLYQTKYIEALKMEYSTEGNLYNPNVTFDYLRGLPNAIAGSQYDVTLTQQFDFPSVYAKKKELANIKHTRDSYLIESEKYDIINQVKLLCIEIIYRNKLDNLINNRIISIEKLKNDFQIKLNNGYGNILDVNKTQLKLIEINNEKQLNQSILKQLNQKLTALNGGNAIQFQDTIYPSINTTIELETILQQSNQNNPINSYLHQEQAVVNQEINVAKAMALPKFEVGYHYQGLLNQNFHGAIVGLSLPLWENKNKVKAKEALLVSNQLKMNDYINQQEATILQQYEQYTIFKNTYNSYDNQMQNYNNTHLLTKALQLGEITTIDYFLETDFIFNMNKNKLETQYQLYNTIIHLLKYLE
ncbi:MAG: TolC family protein [Chitinophagales bacterium]|nr:TolC family protein [Chitinophagales bacterium]